MDQARLSRNAEEGTENAVAAADAVAAAIGEGHELKLACNRVTLKMEQAAGAGYIRTEMGIAWQGGLPRRHPGSNITVRFILTLPLERYCGSAMSTERKYDAV